MHDNHRYRYAPYYVLAAAFLYLGYLASSIQPGVFYQGDGGLKFIVIKQLAAGEEFKYLTITQPQWVQEIWDKGFFPIKPPFIYPSPSGHLISFPPAFQMVSTPFFQWFGYWGLYIIPITSTVLLWLNLIYLCRLTKLSPAITAIALFSVAFASPLTLYGVTYWEHMPTVTLLLAGLIHVVSSPSSKIISFLAGLISGMAVWLRPEALLLNGLYGLCAAWNFRREKSASQLLFLAGMGIAILCFFIFNKTEYGSFLGVHSYQVLQEHTFLYKTLRGVKYSLILNWLLIRFFPFALLLLPLIYLFFKKKPLDTLSKQLMAIIVGFCCLSPFMFPNTGGGQWGPRYFLVIIPAMAVLLARLIPKWISGHKHSSRWMLAIIFLPLVVFSIYENSYRGGVKELRTGNYNRITPALAFVKTQKQEAIIVDIEHVTMEMGSIFRERNFFLAETRPELDSLLTLLKQHGKHEVLYISEQNISPGLPNQLNNAQKDLVKKGVYYFGSYTIP